jgi:hypothetical protein
MLFLLDEGRFHNVFDDKPARWPIAKKKFQNIPQQNYLYAFARRYDH